MSEDNGSGRDESEKVAAGVETTPNELLSKIIAHAVGSLPAWEANETLSSLSRTSRHFQALSNVRAVQRYKESLDDGRVASGAVKHFAFPGGRISDAPYYMRSHDRYIESEVAAFGSGLEFESPEARSQIFAAVDEQASVERMDGFRSLAVHADLLKPSEVDIIEADALEFFLEGTEEHYETTAAADILATRYDHIDEGAQARIHQAISEDPHKRNAFCDFVVSRNPSLLRHENIRSLVREEFPNFENCHEGVAALASYIDKNSRADTDFIIDASYERWGEEACGGDEYRYPYPARAIARVFDGNISDEQRRRIEETRRSDTEEGRALGAAFEELGRDRSAEHAVAHGPRQSMRLVLHVEKLHGMESPVDALGIAGKISETNAAQLNAARRALMNSVTERDDRSR